MKNFILTKWHNVLLLKSCRKIPQSSQDLKSRCKFTSKSPKIEKENIARHACLEDKNISSVIREAFFKVHPDLKEKVNRPMTLSKVEQEALEIMATLTDRDFFPVFMSSKTARNHLRQISDQGEGLTARAGVHRVSPRSFTKTQKTHE